MSKHEAFNVSGFYPAKDNPNVLGRFFDRKKGEDKDGKEVFGTFIEISMPLDRYSKPCIPIKCEQGNKYIERFPDAWKEFKTGHVQKIEGDSILNLDDVEQGRLINLERQGYKTIDAVAKADEATIAKIGFGYRDIHKKAVKYIAERPAIEKPKRKRK
jgi:hypothetical protein